MAESKETQDSNIEVRCYFVRNRNALAVRANFAPAYLDHYLHLMQHEIRMDPDHDGKLKDALAACTLHLASRPWDEVSAWTVHFSELQFNLFVTGNSREGNVIGRVFTEDIKDDGKNLFIAQINNFPKEPRRSIIEFDSNDTMFDITEKFYRKSEQRLARFFSHSEEDFVLISAQPQCDEQWLNSLDNETILSLDGDEELSLLETRKYRYHCGCTPGRILPKLASVSAGEIFGDRDAVNIDCPRCAARFRITREDFEKINHAD